MLTNFFFGLLKKTTNVPIPIPNFHSGSFNGSTAYVDLGNNFDNNGSQTMFWSFWINPSTLTGNQFLISKLDASGTFGYDIALFGNVLHFYIGGSPAGGTAIIVDFSTSMVIGNWYNIIVSYDGSQLASGVTAFLNGNPLTPSVVQNNFVTSSSTTTALTIGQSSIGNLFFTGFMDEIVVGNMVVSSETANNIYNGGVPTDMSGTPGGLSWYRFENTVLIPADTSAVIYDRIGSFNGVNNNVVFSSIVP